MDRTRKSLSLQQSRNFKPQFAPHVYINAPEPSSGSFIVVVVFDFSDFCLTTTNERRLTMCRYKTCRYELSIVARHAAVRDRSAATVDTTTYLGPRDQSEVCFFVFVPRKISARCMVHAIDFVLLRTHCDCHLGQIVNQFFVY